MNGTKNVHKLLLVAIGATIGAGGTMLLARCAADDPSEMTGKRGAREGTTTPGESEIGAHEGMAMPGEADPPAEAGGEREVLYWRAPMDPNYTSDRPGKSPMGMDLVPVYADGADGDGGIRVSRGFLQNFAVRTAVARRGTLPVSIRTVGILAHNEERVVSVQTKYEGWIERASVNNVGETVARGDVLFEIYSPQLVTTQREFLGAMEYLERLREGGAYPEAIERARSLLEAVRERLLYWDMTEEQIDALAESGDVTRTVTVFAPATGFIVDKIGDSMEGLKLGPGMTVLKIADHSTLWAETEFYEDDLRHVREGQAVAIEADDRRIDSAAQALAAARRKPKSEQRHSKQRGGSGHSSVHQSSLQSAEVGRSTPRTATVAPGTARAMASAARSASQSPHMNTSKAA